MDTCPGEMRAGKGGRPGAESRWNACVVRFVYLQLCSPERRTDLAHGASALACGFQQAPSSANEPVFQLVSSDTHLPLALPLLPALLQVAKEPEDELILPVSCRLENLFKVQEVGRLCAFFCLFLRGTAPNFLAIKHLQRELEHRPVCQFAKSKPIGGKCGAAHRSTSKLRRIQHSPACLAIPAQFSIALLRGTSFSC